MRRIYDFVPGQQVWYRGRECQVVDTSAGEVCIMNEEGETLWVEQEFLAEENEDTPWDEEPDSYEVERERYYDYDECDDYDI